MPNASDTSLNSYRLECFYSVKEIQLSLCFMLNLKENNTNEKLKGWRNGNIFLLSIAMAKETACLSILCKFLSHFSEFAVDVNINVVILFYIWSVFKLLHFI